MFHLILSLCLYYLECGTVPSGCLLVQQPSLGCSSSWKPLGTVPYSCTGPKWTVAVAFPISIDDSSYKHHSAYYCYYYFQWFLLLELVLTAKLCKVGVASCPHNSLMSVCVCVVVGWMGSMWSLVRWLAEWTCWRKWRALDRRAVLPQRRSSSRTVDSCRPAVSAAIEKQCLAGRTVCLVVCVTMFPCRLPAATFCTFVRLVRAVNQFLVFHLYTAACWNLWVCRRCW